MSSRNLTLMLTSWGSLFGLYRTSLCLHLRISSLSMVRPRLLIAVYESGSRPRTVQHISSPPATPSLGLGTSTRMSYVHAYWRSCEHQVPYRTRSHLTYLAPPLIRVSREHHADCASSLLRRYIACPSLCSHSPLVLPITRYGSTFSLRPHDQERSATPVQVAAWNPRPLGSCAASGRVLYHTLDHR